MLQLSDKIADHGSDFLEIHGPSRMALVGLEVDEVKELTRIHYRSLGNIHRKPAYVV